jgi:hypothetical protein
MACYNSELPIGPQGPPGPQGPQGEPGTTLGYKVYTALLNQSGEDAPTAIELENTIGNITFSYDDIGQYFLNSIDKFTNLKTWFLITVSGDGGFGGEFITLRYINSDTMQINSGDFSGNGVNSILLNTPIEIRVYP